MIEDQLRIEAGRGAGSVFGVTHLAIIVRLLIQHVDQLEHDLAEMKKTLQTPLAEIAHPPCVEHGGR